MPVTPTYPGVYIEEIPSGVRTITGVATSITAFIGRALRGPVNEATTINSFGDFERIFGGLWVDSTLGYAVRDFYVNRGNQAVIVRLFHPAFTNEDERQKAETAAKAVADAAKAAADGAAAKTAANAKRDEINADAQKTPVEKRAAREVAARLGSVADNASKDDVAKVADAAVTTASRTKAKLKVGDIKLEAAWEGKWGMNLRATADVDVSEEAALRMGLAKADLFNLTVRDVSTGGFTEQFRNLSFKESPRRIDKVLAAESRLVRWEGSWPPSPLPAPAAADDEVTKAEKQLAAAKAAVPPVAADISTSETAVANAKKAMEASDGLPLAKAESFTPTNAEKDKKGLYALEKADLLNLLCIPPYTSSTTGMDVEAQLISDAAAYCEKRRAILLVDSPSAWTDKEKARAGIAAGVGTTSKNAAIFFPRLRQPNALRDNQMEDFVPCGAVAGVFARTDTQRGVWKAPAGLEATLVGVPQLSVPLTDAENGELNPLGVNCLRVMPAVGPVVWGARTLQGDDRLASEWKYIPVRRLALYIEESLYRGTQWVVFEPNDEPLWAQIRLNIGAFMQNLFRQGAFQGATPREAYFVKCDKETTTQNDINLGIVNIVVGFAPLKPAEFVVIKIQQMAGQIQA